MILGMPEGLYTALHVIVSLIGIATGYVVAYGLIKGRILRGWTGVFLATTILTSLSGFGFPVQKLLPSHVIGILSLIVLDIYPASEPPIEGITGEALAKQIGAPARYLASFAEAAEAAASQAQDGDMILTLGAGSVSQLGPMVLERLAAKASVVTVSV